MSELVISQGLNDSQAFLQNIANLQAPFNVTSQSGNYPLVNNVLVNRRLARIWLTVNLASRVFVDDLGVTSASAEGENVGMLRIPLLYMPPRLKRTLASSMSASDGSNGTPGNNKPFNVNLPNGMQTNGYDLKFMQLYDEAAQVARTEMALIGSNLDLLGQYTSNIPKTVAMLQDCDILATHVASALAHSASVSNRNIIAYNPSTTTNGYLQGIMNSLVSSLSNVRGSYAEGVVSYDKKRSVIVMRWSLYNQLMTINNGAIINSDIGQRILLNGYLDDSGTKLLGSAIEGKYGGVYIKVVPDEYWDTAAATLNLSADQYAQWNKIVAYIANADGTMFGQSYNITDIDKSPTTSPGFIIRNAWGWGIKNVRPSSVALVVSTADNLADFTNPVTKFDDINSPNNIESIVESYQNGAATSTNAVQRIAVTPANLITTVTLTVQGTSETPLTEADVVVVDQFGNYPTVTNVGDGTYTFDLGRATTANVAVSAANYQSSSASISAGNTATATYSTTVTLTAAD